MDIHLTHFNLSKLKRFFSSPAHIRLKDERKGNFPQQCGTFKQKPSITGKEPADSDFWLYNSPSKIFFNDHWMALLVGFGDDNKADDDLSKVATTDG